MDKEKIIEEQIEEIKEQLCQETDAIFNSYLLVENKQARDLFISVLTLTFLQFIDSEIERKKGMRQELDLEKRPRARGYNQAINEDITYLEALKDK